jgi:hypothetical protein
VRTGKHLYITLPALLLGALGGSGLSAQEGYSYAFKARGGLTAGDMQTTHFDNKILSFGAEVRKAMFGEGRGLTLEVAWEYVPGRNYSVMKPINGDDLDPFRSVDMRKEYGQGFSYKVAYNAPFKLFSWMPEMEWFGGVSLDMHSVRTEIEYTLYHPSAPGNWPPGTTDSNKYQGDSKVEQSTAISPGIFGGIRHKLGDGTSCELTLRNFGMRHHDFTPGIYFGSETGKLESGTSRGWSLEFALAVKI